MDKLAFGLDGLRINYFAASLRRRVNIAVLTLMSVLALTACGGGGGGQNNNNASSVSVSKNSAEPASSTSETSSSFSVSSQSWQSASSTRSLVGPLSSLSSSSSSLSVSSISSTSSLSRSSSSQHPFTSSSSSLSSRSIASSSAAASITSIVIAPNKVVLSAGASQQLVAVGLRDDKSLVNLFGQVTWRVVSGESVASVDANGLLKRLTAGNAEIEAKSQGKTVLLKITSDVQSLSLRYDNTVKKWTKPHIYLWTGEGTSKIEPVGKWPGLAMDAGASDLWSYTVAASALKNGAINVIFNDGVVNGGGGAAHQTGDLVAKESALYNGAWIPINGGTSAQLSVLDGQVENGRMVVDAGSVVKISANKPAEGASFAGWQGASAAYIFTDPSKANAQIVIPTEVPSLFLQAHFLTAADPFAYARSLYASQCASCHGVNGVGGTDAALNNLASSQYTLESLTRKIRTTMPKGGVGQCIGDAPGSCAYDIANLILENAWPQADSCTGANCALDSRNSRLLTTEEYLNSVRDIFAINFDAALLSPAAGDPFNRNFNTSSSITLDESRTLGYQMASEAIAKQVIETKTFFSLASNCGSDAKCVVAALGKKIFRRKLSTEEIARYADLYTSANGGKAVIQGLLISPNFMYRSEKGVWDANIKLYRLTPYEIATLLSYSFWVSTPDDALLAAADSGNLDIRAQVTRLLNDKVRAERGLRRFASGWLIDGRYGFSGMPASLASALQEETIRFTTESISADEPYKTLLTANYTYANAELSKYYGSATVASGWGPSIFPASDPRRGSGLLGHASFLASHITNMENPSPIKRGLFVRGVLMCQELPPPQKAGVSIPRKPTDSNREANFNHTNDEACYGCHQYIDGIGFGFESFGSNGLFRSEEILGNGTPKKIDATGTIKSLNSGDGPLDSDSPDVTYNSISELANLIANSGQGSSCYSRQFYRYIVGRDESEMDEKIIPSYSANLRAGGGMREMLIDLALNPSFVLRRK